MYSIPWPIEKIRSPRFLHVASLWPLASAIPCPHVPPSATWLLRFVFFPAATSDLPACAVPSLIGCDPVHRDKPARTNVQRASGRLSQAPKPTLSLRSSLPGGTQLPLSHVIYLMHITNIYVKSMFNLPCLQSLFIRIQDSTWNSS
jgi:hypothetical protein